MILRKGILAFILISGLLVWACRLQNPHGTDTPDNQGANSKKGIDTLSDYPSIDTSSLPVSLVPGGDYGRIKEQIQAERNRFSIAYAMSTSLIEKERILDSARSYIYNMLLNRIIPFWYGVKWDFNGYANDPYEGKISCAYFVSTTLRDVGFNLNRYKFAQQKPEWEASTLGFGHDIMIFENPGLSSVSGCEILLHGKISDGLYFVGLDNHVGYLLVLAGNIYFINSSHIIKEVVFEKARFSKAFRSSQYQIVEISANDKLIACWIYNDPIEVVDSDSSMERK